MARSLFDHDEFDGFGKARSLQASEVDAAGESGTVEGDAIVAGVHHLISQRCHEAAGD